MNSRRKFISDIFNISMVGTGIMLFPSIALSKKLDNIFFGFDEISPYEIDISEKSIKDKLKIFTMPVVVKDVAIEITPNKKIWSTGEGKNEFKDEKIINFFDKNNQIKIPPYGYTPVKKLFGVKGGHDVYGQWFEIRPNDFRGIIKGFDNTYYSVYHNFKDLFTHEYYCFGLPSDNYVLKTCEYCNDTYIYQNFKSDCNSKDIKVYAWYKGCKKSITGNHDNFKIKIIEPCIPRDQYEIGQDY